LSFLTAILIGCATGVVSAWSAPFGAPHPAAGMSASGLTGWIFAEQAAFYRSLSGFIRASKEDGAAMWELFGISFVYGIFHAVGPGHGKAVISSYVIANEETWRRGMILSFASAGIQSIVAIVVVAIAAVLLGATAKAIGLTVHLVEITSYGLVILIGLRLLYVKGRGFLIACRELTWTRAPVLGVATGYSGKTFQLPALALARSPCVAGNAWSMDAPCTAFIATTTITSRPGDTPMARSPLSSPARAAGAGGWPRWSRSDCGPAPARSSC
jgi:nickel/cobalt transporter (NicO) family protein